MLQALREKAAKKRHHHGAAIYFQRYWRLHVRGQYNRARTLRHEGPSRSTTSPTLARIGTLSKRRSSADDASSVGKTRGGEIRRASTGSVGPNRAMSRGLSKLGRGGAVLSGALSEAEVLANAVLQQQETPDLQKQLMQWRLGRARKEMRFARMLSRDLEAEGRLASVEAAGRKLSEIERARTQRRAARLQDENATLQKDLVAMGAAAAELKGKLDGMRARLHVPQHVVAGVAKTAERNELRMQRLARAVADLRADAAALIKAEEAAGSPEPRPRRRSFGF